MFEDFARPLVALRFEGGFRPFSNENGFRLFGERIVLIMNKHIPEKISRFFQDTSVCLLDNSVLKKSYSNAPAAPSPMDSVAPQQYIHGFRPPSRRLGGLRVAFCAAWLFGYR